LRLKAINSIKRRFEKIAFILLCLLLMTVAISFHGIADAQDDFLSVTGPCNQTFPQDHGPHPGYRTEWWYYTGNLTSDSGGRYGFQLTFFRSQLSPTGAAAKWPRPSSDWRTQQIFLGHAAISDLGGKVHHHTERMARQALGMAGTKQVAGVTTVFIKPWSVTINADTHILKASASNFSIDLTLQAAKPPVLHGDAGYSRKGSQAQNASCYYSITRLQARGQLIVDGQPLAVEGSGWMDHEYSTAPLETGIVGWDWFSLQLSDQTELMLYLLRQPADRIHAASSGTFIDPAGKPQHLSRQDFKITVLKRWKSPQTNAVYPVAWRLNILPLGIVLTVNANLTDQEMTTIASTGVIYWEGSVSATGRVENQPVTAEGYTELTGYADAFQAPL
jgi:predicted secreted hydrolase